MRVAYPLRAVLESAGLSSLLWGVSFLGNTAPGRKLSVREIIAGGL